MKPVEIPEILSLLLLECLLGAQDHKTIRPHNVPKNELANHDLMISGSKTLCYIIFYDLHKR